jgi:hypothetical protein
MQQQVVRIAQWSVVSGQWLVVSGQWLVVSGQWSGALVKWSVVIQTPYALASWSFTFRLPRAITETAQDTIRFSVMEFHLPRRKPTRLLRRRRQCWSLAGSSDVGLLGQSETP